MVEGRSDGVVLTHKVSLTNGIHAVQADGSKLQLCKERGGQSSQGWLELECSRLPQPAGDCEPLSSPRIITMLNFYAAQGLHC